MEKNKKQNLQGEFENFSKSVTKMGFLLLQRVLNPRAEHLVHDHSKRLSLLIQIEVQCKKAHSNKHKFIAKSLFRNLQVLDSITNKL
jgi:hypothetical protein